MVKRLVTLLGALCLATLASSARAQHDDGAPPRSARKSTPKAAAKAQPGSGASTLRTNDDPSGSTKEKQSTDRQNVDQHPDTNNP